MSQHDCEELLLGIIQHSDYRAFRKDVEQHSTLEHPEIQASLNLDVSQGSQLGEETSAYNVLEYS